MKPTAIFRHPVFLEHIKDFSHVESPERLRVLYDAMDDPGATDGCLLPDCPAAGHDLLTLVHDRAHVERVAATAGKAFESLDPDTQTSPLSYEAACRAAGAAAAAVDLVMAGEARNAFCLVRPPGHHAEAGRAMGFCLFNNVAVAARHAIKNHGLSRVLIVDWDLHHGNGTQHRFYDTSAVLYFSTHQFPYYPGTGAAGEMGSGDGEGYTINVPLAAGHNNMAYATIYNELLAPIARQYRPEIIILSAGYDIHANDPLGGMSVTGDGFAYMTKVLVDVAADVCDGRLVACLEGGYDLAGLKEGVLATLDEMRGRSRLADKTIFDMAANAYPVMALEETRQLAKSFWNL